VLRLAVPGIIYLILLGVWAYALFDVMTADTALIRTMRNKLTWLAVVAVFFVFGAFAWFAFGRPRGAPLVPGSPRAGPSRSWQQSRRPGRPPDSAVPRDWVDRVREARASDDDDEGWAGAAEDDSPDDPDEDDGPYGRYGPYGRG